MTRLAPLAAALALLLLLPAGADGQGTPPPPPGAPPPGALPPNLAPAAPAPAPAAQAAAPGTGVQGEDGATWPRAMQLENGALLVYQPQVEKLAGATLTGRAAISWEAKGKEPTFGVFWFEAQLLIDKEDRTYDIERLKVTKIRFPNLTPEAERRGAAYLEKEIPQWDLGGSLDELTAGLAAAQKEAQGVKGLQSRPPGLVFSRDPAVLLLYDGKPLLRPVEGAAIERAVNTPLLVLRDPAASRCYLAGGTSWYEAAEPTGPWQVATSISPAVKAFLDKNPPPPAEPTAAGAPAPPTQPAKAEAPPRIIVATEPTELIVFDGNPNYVPVTGEPDLLFVDNADGQVLLHVPTSETYVLLSGRWFKARSLDGPWSAVRPDQLPPAFAKIPTGSPAAEVRTFVAGTEEARDALADTQIPQTTAVKRDQQLTVTYDGEPKFKAIEGTGMAYAVNTPYSVIQDAGKYWACYQAVWYVAATPKGPWVVSDKRPPSIDQVPPSAPVYNTRYVYVYQSTPQVVYVGYLPGYMGMYPYYGTVVYGTGYYYPPYVGPVYYYPYPATFGVHMTYNPWTGFGVGVSYGTPFVSVGIHFGGYGHYGYHGCYGPAGYRPPPRPPYGYRPPPPGYRPPAGGYPGGRPPPGGGAPGARPPGGGPGGPTASNNLYNRPDNSSRNAPRDQAAAGRKSAAPAASPNNVYGDKSGNVYRQNQGGGWDKNTGQGWKPEGGGAGAGGGAGGSAGARPSASPQPASRPSSGGGQGGAGARPAPSSAPSGLSNDAAARSRGAGGGSRGGGGRGGGRR